MAKSLNKNYDFCFIIAEKLLTADIATYVPW